MKKAILQLHLAIFLYGFTAILGKMITLQVAPMLLWRIFFAILLLWGMAIYQKTYKLDNYKILFSVFGVGFLMTLHWFFFYGSVKVSTVSNALAAFSTIAFFTAVMEPLFEKKKIHIFELMLGLLSFVGIVIIFKFDTQYRLGVLYGLFAALTGSSFSIINKNLVKKISPKKLTLYSLTSVFIFLILLFPLFELAFPSTSFIPDKRDLLLLLIFAFFCTIWTFQLLFNAQKKVSAFTVGISFNLEPLYGVILAFIFLQENKHWSLTFLLGFSLVLLSSLLQMLRLWKPDFFQFKKHIT